MPKLLWLDPTAWLDNRISSNGMAAAEALETVSHDRLTRLWQAGWFGHTLGPPRARGSAGSGVSHH